MVGHYKDYTIYANGTEWSQGIMESLILQTLEGLDLKSMGHNSPQYIHTVPCRELEQTTFRHPEVVKQSENNLMMDNRL